MLKQFKLLSLLGTLTFLTTLVILNSGCDEHGLSPSMYVPPDTTTGISGKITYIGEWPSNTLETWVLAIQKYSTNPVEVSMQILTAPKDSIQNFATTYDYILPTQPDTFEVVFVVVRLVGQAWGLNSLAGLYYANGDTTIPGVAIVKKGATVKNCDITVDFNHYPAHLPGMSKANNISFSLKRD